MKKVLWIVISVIVLGLVLFYFISGTHYSDGERSGVLRKFSHKGLVFKTYEGEMLNGGCKNYMMTGGDKVFYFSGDKSHPECIDSLNAWNGRCVMVHYYQVLGSFPWQVDTKYFVDKVKLAKD